MATEDSVSPDIMHCPFCEEDDMLECKDFGSGSVISFLVHCKYCDATGPGYNTYGGAVDAWNKAQRYTLEERGGLLQHAEIVGELKDRIMELEDEIEKLKNGTKEIMELLFGEGGGKTDGLEDKRGETGGVSGSVRATAYARDAPTTTDSTAG